MPGLPEIIVILMMSLGLGVEKDPAPPTSEDVHRYAIADADYTLYINAKAILPPTVKRVIEMAQKPMMRELMGEAMANQVEPQIEMMRKTAKDMVGFDPISDVHWAAAWVDLKNNTEPNILIAAQGDWPPNLLEIINRHVEGQVVTINGYKVLREPTGQASIALISKQVMVAGTPDLVNERLAKNWTPSAPSAAATELLKGGPHLYLMSHPSAQAKTILKTAMKDDMEFFSWLILEHSHLGGAVYHDGTTMLWQADTADNTERVQLAFEAVLSLTKAFNHGAEGLGKALVAFLPETSDIPQLVTLYTHRETILKMLEEFTSTKDFSGKVTTNASANSVRLDTKGGSMLASWPMGILPALGAAVGVSVVREVSQDPPETHMKEPPSVTQ